MNFVKKMFGLTLIATSITYATTTETIHQTETKKTYESLCYTSDCMSTHKLQEVVEKLSVEGKLPFEMGLELIKRWSEDKIS
jgi:hypothetical protein